MELTKLMVGFGFLILISLGIDGWLNDGTEFYLEEAIDIGANYSQAGNTYMTDSGTDKDTVITEGQLITTGTEPWYTGVGIVLKNLITAPKWSTAVNNMNAGYMTTLYIPSAMQTLLAGIILFAIILTVFAAWLRWKM